MKNFLIPYNNTYNFPYLYNTLNTIKSTRLFSTTMPKTCPTRDENNARKNVERLEKAGQDFRKKADRMDSNTYRVMDDYLSGSDTPDKKIEETIDHAAEIKGDYAIKLQAHEKNGLRDDHPDVKKTNKEYKQ